VNGSEKHSSLLRYGNNYGRKSLIVLALLIIRVGVFALCKQWGRNFSLVSLAIEVLLNGKAQYGRPPCAH